MTEILKTCCPLRSQDAIITPSQKRIEFCEEPKNIEQQPHDEKALTDELDSLDYQNRFLVARNNQESPYIQDVEPEECDLNPDIVDSKEWNPEVDDTEDGNPCTCDDCPEKQMTFFEKYHPSSMTEALIMSGYRFHDDIVDSEGKLAKAQSFSIGDINPKDIENMKLDDIDKFLAMKNLID